MKRKLPAPRKKSAQGAHPPARLWLVRHAHAREADDDAARPLSQRGCRQVRTLAKFLATSRPVQPAEIWHSPLLRARQTAQLLTKFLRLAAPLIETAGLAPFDDPRIVARRINPLRRDVAIVGHEPHLSALASLLVAGSAAPPAFALKKCAVLALERAPASWVVRWQVSPELLA